MIYRELLSDFEEETAKMQRATMSSMEEAMMGIQICNDTLSEFRVAVTNNGFKNEGVEIQFFKNVKSEPLGILIYYTEMRSCEMRIPKWGLQAKFEFIEVEIARVNSFFEQYPDFRLYMENGSVENDQRYFTRKHHMDRPLALSSPYFRDPMFNTSHDELWATIKGFGLYGNHLKGLYAELKAGSKQTTGPPGKKDPPFRFTMPPTAAMEFIYAFKEVRAFNHGNFDIKPFTDYFCEVFGIEINDPYGLFAQITNRKTKRAKYIQMLLDAFLNSLDRRDGFS